MLHITKPRVALNHVWWATPVLLSYAMLSLAPLREGDLWWHLRLGESIATMHILPQIDEWTVAGAGLPFNVAHSWLADVVLYILNAGGGPAALVVQQAVIGALTVTLLLRMARTLGAAARGAAALSLVSLLALYPFSTARPQILSFLLFACFEVILLAANAGKTRWLVPLPVLMAIWVNVHGAWVMGLALVGMYEVGWLWASLSGRRALRLLWPTCLQAAGSLWRPC